MDAQKATQPGMVMGTPYYMAPEQARGDSGIDHRVDLWAVGVIVYEALTGRRPFVANNYNALLVKILTSDPKPIDRLVENVPPELVRLVDRALKKLPEDRYQSATEFTAALSAVQRNWAAEDPQAPTLVMRRSALRDELASRGWQGDIDDPETNVDDVTSERNGETDRAPASVPAPDGSDGGDTEIMPRPDVVLEVPHRAVPRPPVVPRPEPRRSPSEERSPRRFERAVGTGMLLVPKKGEPGGPRGGGPQGAGA
jgi:serine/threonine-protein kinase